MSMPAFRDDLRAAVEQDHPCTDDNACDIAKAIESGCELWGAYILQGATECPATDMVMRRVRTFFDSDAAFDAALEADRVRLLAENPHASCPECNALVWMGDETEVVCGNCRAQVKIEVEEDEE